MQFSIHYLSDSEDKVRGLLKNVSESLKHNGYLLVTTLDGPSVFNRLKKSKNNKIEGKIIDKKDDTEKKLGLSLIQV